MPALLALAAAMTFGVADFLGGRAAHRAPLLVVTVVTNLTGALLAVVLLIVFGGDWTLRTVALGAVGGASGLVGLSMLYLGLATGPNRLVSPLSAITAGVVPVAAGIALGERPEVVVIVGLALVPPAVWLIAGGELAGAAAARGPILLAVGAGFGYGFFFVALSQVDDGAGAVPLVTARIASIALLLIALAITRPSVVDPRALPIAALAGMLDMTANGLFLWSSRDGDLAVVGALVNLFPITTVALARVVLDERMTRAQFAGIALAVIAAIALS